MMTDYEVYAIGQMIHVIDKADNKRKSCKVVDIDDSLQKIKIHYVKWSKTYDEWLELSSNRIVSEDDDDISEQSFYDVDTTDNLPMKEVIGKLLDLGDQSYKTVISAYEIGKHINVNEINLNRFTQHCFDTQEMCGNSQNKMRE